MRKTVISCTTAAVLLALALAACGSSAASSSAPSTTRPATHATTPAAASAPASTPGTTPSPAATATLTPGAPIPATTTLATAPGAVLWCGQVAYGTKPATISPMSAWLAYESEEDNLAIDGNRTEFTTTVDDIESPSTTLAAEHQLAGSLCAEVRALEAFPPPAQTVLFGKAMSNFLEASVLLKTSTAGDGSSLPYLQAGTADMSALLAAARAPTS